MHILHNRHESGLAEETLKLLKPCTKGTKMNCWEALYMNMHYRQGALIPEQQVTDTNLLFNLTIIPRDLWTTPLHSSSQPDAVRTHTPHDKSRFISYYPFPSGLFYIDHTPINSPFLLQSRICRQTPSTHIISACEPSYVISIKYRLSLPDDGSYVIQNMLE
jgi:hypothetical protein